MRPWRSGRGSMLLQLVVAAACVSTCRASIAAASYTCNSSCQQAQQAALSQLYADTNGASWQEQSGWANFSSQISPSLDAHCSWQGVVCCNTDSVLGALGNGSLGCSSPGAVLALALPDNGLSGSLSNSVLGNLSSLVQLDLQGQPGGLSLSGCSANECS